MIKIKARFLELWVALVFFTRIPWPTLPKNAPKLAQTLWAWPLVGLFVGACMGVAWMLAYAIGFTPLIASIFTIMTGCIITGALHEDGLADCADSFGAYAPERRREIMKDSHIGTFGVIALILLFVIRVGALTAIGDSPLRVMAVMIIAHMCGRLVSLPILVCFQPAEGNGLRRMLDEVSFMQALKIVGMSLMIVMIISAVAGIGIMEILAAMLVSLLGAFLFARFMVKRIDGYTGDVIGASIIVAEALFLVVISIP